MQLTWSKSKPTEPKANISSDQTDDPFHLDPLSLQASIHARDRNSRSRPKRSRNFKFVAEKAPRRKQPLTESCEARIVQSFANRGEVQAHASVQQIDNTTNRSNFEYTLSNSLLGALDDGVHGEMEHSVVY
jgi:hypothetical protein